jgi:hypothetical protein
MSFSLTPELTLTNDTAVQGDLSLDFYLLKNIPDELGGGDVFHQEYPISNANFSVFNDTFDLAGVSPQVYAVVA